MKKTTRNRLIEYMRIKKVVSAAELARIFKLSAGDARHHLACLEDEGLVIMVDTRIQGRGRPTQLFRLAQDVNRHNLDALTNASMKVLFDSITENGREAALRNIAASLTEGCNPPEGNLPLRLAYTIRFLNNMNYVARWEAHSDAPRILISHCPYVSVVANHPETCLMDTFLIGIVLGQSVLRISSEGNNVAGNMICHFRLDTKTLTIDTPATAN